MPVDPELDAAGASAEQGLEDHSQRGFSPVHSCIEEADSLKYQLERTKSQYKGYRTGVICL